MNIFGYDIADALNDVLNKMFEFFTWAVNLMPGSPFTDFITGVPSSFNQTMGFVNYFVPVSFCLQIATAWLASILIYYVVQLILRWIKAIE